MKIKRIISLLLVLICVFTPIDAFACLYSDGTMSEEELEKDIRYWWQGRVPNDNSLITGKYGSDTIGAGACSHFSMTYALVKMGIFNPANGDTPITHIKNAREKGAFLVDWGYFDFSRVSELYPDVTYEGRDNNVSGMNATDGLAYVKGKMNEGYYVVGIVYGSLTNGHCIFFDGINEDGTTSIGDSAYNGITWEGIYGASGVSTYFSYLELLKCKGKNFNSQPSIYDKNALRGANSKEIAEYHSLVKEWDLKGMPQKTNLKSGVIHPQIVDYRSLSQEEKGVVQSIRDIKEGEQLSFFDIMKTVISFIGLVLILYALLLLIAYIFDRANSFLNISLVSILTLGHIKVSQKEDILELDDEKLKKKGYMTTAKLFIIIAIIFIMGALLISGFISYLIYSLIQGVVST